MRRSGNWADNFGLSQKRNLFSVRRLGSFFCEYSCALGSNSHSSHWFFSYSWSS